MVTKYNFSAKIKNEKETKLTEKNLNKVSHSCSVYSSMPFYIFFQLTLKGDVIMFYCPPFTRRHCKNRPCRSTLVGKTVGRLVATAAFWREIFKADGLYVEGGSNFKKIFQFYALNKFQCENLRQSFSVIITSLTLRMVYKKVHIFWEGHKILGISPFLLTVLYENLSSKRCCSYKVPNYFSN